MLLPYFCSLYISCCHVVRVCMKSLKCVVLLWNSPLLTWALPYKHGTWKPTVVSETHKHPVTPLLNPSWHHFQMLGMALNISPYSGGKTMSIGISRWRRCSDRSNYATSSRRDSPRWRMSNVWETTASERRRLYFSSNSHFMRCYFHVLQPPRHPNMLG